MSTKDSRNKKNKRKAVLIGIGIGILVMPVIFLFSALGTEWTAEKVIWFFINSTCTGAILGGGIGYLLMANDIRF